MDAFAKQQFNGQTMMSLRMLFNRNKTKDEENKKASMQLTKQLPNGDKITEIHQGSRNNESIALFSYAGSGGGGGGNFIPGAAGVGIIETTLTKAMDEEGMLGPAINNEKGMVLFEDQREKKVFSSEAGKRSELLKSRIMRDKDGSNDAALMNLGFERLVSTAVGGDRYTKIGG